MKTILIILSCIVAFKWRHSYIDLSKKQNATEISEIITVDEIQSKRMASVIEAEDKYFNKWMCLKGRFYSLNISFNQKYYELKLDYIRDSIFTSAVTCKFSKADKKVLKHLKKVIF